MHTLISDGLTRKKDPAPGNNILDSIRIDSVPCLSYITQVQCVDVFVWVRPTVFSFFKMCAFAYKTHTHTIRFDACACACAFLDIDSFFVHYSTSVHMWGGYTCSLHLTSIVRVRQCVLYWMYYSQRKDCDNAHTQMQNSCWTKKVNAYRVWAHMLTCNSRFCATRRKANECFED